MTSEKPKLTVSVSTKSGKTVISCQDELAKAFLDKLGRYTMLNCAVGATRPEEIMSHLLALKGCAKAREYVLRQERAGFASVLGKLLKKVLGREIYATVCGDKICVYDKSLESKTSARRIPLERVLDELGISSVVCPEGVFLSNEEAEKLKQVISDILSCRMHPLEYIHGGED